MLLMTSCDSFLERKAQNLVVPTKCSQYKEMLNSEGYFDTCYSAGWWIYLMTDDIAYFNDTNGDDSKIVESYYFQGYRNIYTFQPEIELEDEGFTDKFFRYMYEQALVANLVLEAIDDLEGTEEEHLVLRGQALFHRAYAYFLLANTYCDVYSEENRDTPGIYLNLSYTPKVGAYGRNTIGEVWDQIKKDLEDSMECLKDYTTLNRYEIDYKAPLHLAARTALFMGDWKLCRNYSEEMLALNPKLFDITAKTACTNTKDTFFYNDDVIGFISTDNPEILVVMGRTNSGGIGDKFNGGSATSLFAVSEDLVDCYQYDEIRKSGDHRLPFFFHPPLYPSCAEHAAEFNHYIPFKFDYDDGYVRGLVFRTGETYLNLAEACLHLGEMSVALQYLNTLRAARIDNYTPLAASDFTSDDYMLRFLFEERRRELCFEEYHRWWDLRRSGKPSVSHVWKDGLTYSLEEGDAAYTLAWPLEERQIDESVANDRPPRQGK